MNFESQHTNFDYVLVNYKYSQPQIKILPMCLTDQKRTVEIQPLRGDL